MAESRRTRSTDVKGMMVRDVEEREVVARSRSATLHPRAWEETERLDEATLPGAEEVDAKDDDILGERERGRGFEQN